MKALSKYPFELSLLFLVLIGLFIPAIPILYISIAYFMLMLFRLNAVEIVYMCNMVLSTVLGALFYSYGIDGIGGFVFVFGVAVFVIGVLNKEIRIKSFYGLLMPLLIIVVYLAFSVFTSTGGDVAVSKLVHTFVMGVVSVLAFGALFNNTNKVHTTLLSLHILIAAVLTMLVAIKVNDINGPESFFDVGFLRLQTSINDYLVDEELFRISYHLPGSIALQAFGIFFMREKYCKKIPLAIITLLCFFPILYSGARQSVVVFLIMVFFAWRQNLTKVSQSSIKKVLSISVTVFIIAMVVLALAGNIFLSITEKGLMQGSGRESDYIRAIVNFQNNPLFGIGYGRDNVDGVYNQYAHNMFFELLGETGLAGLSFFVFIFVRYFIKSKIYISEWLILFLAFFGPAMFSNGFDGNVKVFTFIFAAPYMFSKRYISLSVFKKLALHH